MIGVRRAKSTPRACLGQVEPSLRFQGNELRGAHHLHSVDILIGTVGLEQGVWTFREAFCKTLTRS